MSYNTSCLSNPWLLLGCRRPLPDDAACPVTASCRHGTTSVYREITRIAGGNSQITERQSTPSGARIGFVPKIFPGIRPPTRQGPQNPKKVAVFRRFEPDSRCSAPHQANKKTARTSQFPSTTIPIDRNLKGWLRHPVDKPTFYLPFLTDLFLIPRTPAFPLATTRTPCRAAAS